MGYRRPSKTYVLQFEDDQLAGLEVKARGASTGQLMKLMDLTELSTRGFRKEDIKEVDKLFELFASKITEWNLEDEDGNPLPVSYDSLMDQDMDFTLDLVFAWVHAVVGISGPLEQNSGDGEPFPEASIPMESQSLSLVS